MRIPICRVSSPSFCQLHFAAGREMEGRVGHSHPWPPRVLGSPGAGASPRPACRTRPISSTLRGPLPLHLQCHLFPCLGRCGERGAHQPLQKELWLHPVPSSCSVCPGAGMFSFLSALSMRRAVGSVAMSSRNPGGGPGGREEGSGPF